MLKGKFYNNLYFSSKKKYIWKFSIDNVDQEIVLLISSLSGKKEVRYNGRPIH